VKLKRERVTINYIGDPENRREVDGYRVGEFLTVHRSVNHKRRTWTVTHDKTGFCLIDGIRTRYDAVTCATTFRRCALRMRAKYGAHFN
jgi:hypothetical protein